jgi:hypothetical protein
MSTERTERRRLTDEELRLFIRERRTAEPGPFRALFLEETRRHG